MMEDVVGLKARFNIQNQLHSVYTRMTFRVCYWDNLSMWDKHFEGVYFQNCNFQNVVFHRCNFKNCTFEECSLLGTDWRGEAVMTDVTFRKCGFTRFALSKLVETDNIRLYDCFIQSEYMNNLNRVVDVFHNSNVGMYREG